MSWIRVILVNGVVLILLFEFVSLALTKLGALPVSEDPPYRFKVQAGHEWRNEREIWGAWHKKNSVARHLRPCFDVAYQSNDVGVRDDVDYLTLNSADNVVLIGDSFAEGYGVDLADSFSKRLFRNTGKQVLNFGASGDHGPVQEYLVYRELASMLPHNEVIYFFLPANDFIDNSPVFQQQLYGNRYRPYFLKDRSGEGYSIYYPPQSSPSEEFPSDRSDPRPTLQKLYGGLRSLLVRFTYAANVLRSFTHLWRNLRLTDGPAGSLQRASGYFTDDTESIEGSLYYVGKFLDLIPADYKKTIVIIPGKQDIDEILEQGWEYEHLDWYEGLTNLALTHNAKVLDLAKTFGERKDKSWLREGASRWYLSCDGHWSSAGNQMASERFLDSQD